MQGPPHSSQTELPICARRLCDDFHSVVTDWGFLSPQPACLALSLHSSISVLVCFTPSGAVAAPPATVQGEHIAARLSSQSVTLTDTGKIFLGKVKINATVYHSL